MVDGTRHSRDAENDADDEAFNIACAKKTWAEKKGQCGRGDMDAKDIGKVHRYEMSPEIGHAREAYVISFGIGKLSGSACECRARRVSDFTWHSHIAEAD